MSFESFLKTSIERRVFGGKSGILNLENDAADGLFRGADFSQPFDE